ncbi:type II toxin-antitoxin system VapC family toxin [Deinococcus radiophilus]|uniref:Type II toxin-antitoxin system VapC family toxin n=1 Tax=Deinococcus radiophilus TaxID=32062 RepID=A0A431VQ54_9DEIO|nr:type II toxin-antitoxin system VapC family toxin [Deinococcus radiophilus]RTR25311.1 type II toxin-antitoxin system VapC family toxin [Deinococcus radiophilus]UFA52066.1 type II toxin-antitoxin system VapC family toxin [Deinococcus radiophilus]
MTICLDTNVLSALFTGEEGAGELARQLFHHQQQESLIIHAAVRAELMALPGMNAAMLDQQLSRLSITVDTHTPAAIWDETARTFAEYAQRRRKSGGGQPRRLLADFFIGAHAAEIGARLMTLDPQHYRQAFPGLELLP